ncbi:membrane protein [Salinimicrobium marinum]|uniref:Membrane protein n=1 Tax=Salinimicrobium marinum TaxID=680283 RepID=A0A918SEV4_9FLAO|nr:DUF2723 domain-containing protein [Salinimicrobium marinum]GHA35188.1 membrane protein [Salinimicrobium marinum]
MKRINFSFNFLNQFLGWLVFVIALVVYTWTLEPTTSFWDAGEYIATAANLEVGHPPGAPVYQMFGAFFATFALDSSQVALMVNFMSALSSAFTIMFMFRSIVLLLLKISGSNDESSIGSKIAVLGSALTGALAFTFTDSFWFNAVEAEVYAMSTCFMALLFYLGLLWERDMFKYRGNRWVILICFMTGLSFGVHFLTLLALPAVGLLYYFKNYQKVTIRNFIRANIVVVVVLLFIFKFLLPYTLRFTAASEIFFTNTMKFPFNSGTVISVVLIISIFYFGINYTRRKGFFQLNTLLLCILFILIGFSGWTMLPIRANANTVINENSPDNARELLAYYNREQYGEVPLFYGPQYTEMYSGLDPENPYKDDAPNYEKNKESNRYIIVNDYENARYNFHDKHKTFLPRMWSKEHIANYMRIAGTPKFNIKQEYQGEEQLVQAVAEFRRNVNSGRVGGEEYHSFLNRFRDYLEIEKPSFLQNVQFMLEYQMGYMYWRYFMWNFVGRQNDIQGKYTDLNGNWLSGIDVIDEARLGSQENLPADMESNKARNTYYFIPLLLGIAGLLFHFQRDWKMFWVLTVFFLFTGIALKVYLNEYPFQVRERDYALVGSFYVFSIWIGFGVYAFFTALIRIFKPKSASIFATVISLFAGPVLLASENWDDHDRSGRYTALAMAKMYLDSVDEDAILFTTGDNDTFLLWYVQQIEGYRRDVRIVNTMLLGTDWYIDQMKRKAWDSEPVPSQLEHKQYRAGTNDYIMHQPVTSDTLNIKSWMNWIESDNSSTMAELQSGRMVKTFPTKLISVPVNKEKVLEKGIVHPKDADEIVDNIYIELKDNAIYKNELLMLDILANNDWTRPVYFSGGSFGDEDYLWMKDHLQLDGIAYKLVPIKTSTDPENPLQMGRIETDKMYEIVNKWDWGNMGDETIYHDPETRRNSISYRTSLARLVNQLLQEGDEERAKIILDMAMKNMPVDFYNFYFLYDPYINGYFEVNEPEKALILWENVAAKYQENLLYYSGWDLERQYENTDQIFRDLQQYHSLLELLNLDAEEEFAAQKKEEFNQYLNLFQYFLQQQ